MKFKNILKKKLKEIKILRIIVANIKTTSYNLKFKFQLIFWRIYSIYLNKNNKENSKRILIVKPDAIGDFIIFSKYLRSYIDLYKDYEIDVLINKVNHEIAEDCEEIREIISIDIKTMSNYDGFKLMKHVVNQNYNKVIYPVNSREVIIDKLCILSNAKEIVTFSGDNCNISNGRKTFNNKYFSNVINSTNSLVHETIHNEEFLMKLGCKKNDYKTFIKIKENNVKFLNDCVEQNEKYVVLVPGCQAMIRFWSEEKYAEIIEYLCNIKKLKVIILGSRSEMYLVSSILSKVVVDDMGLLINLAGKTDLHNMITIISKASFYIGSETSAVHIAELYNVKSICIIGGGHYNKFYPYPNSEFDYPVTVRKSCFNCDWICIYDKAKCIKEVTAKCVKNTIDKIMEEEKL